MKIKEDFVTNSSSTSFILATKNEPTREFLKEKLGVNGKFALDFIFNDLISSIIYEKEEIHAHIERYYPDKTVNDFLIEKGFDEETVSSIVAMDKDGKIVYFGRLSSDAETGAESFFCQESFVVVEKDFYLNCEIGGW